MKGARHLKENAVLLDFPGGLFLLIPCETLFFRQTFEMKPRKNDIWLTVNGAGSPTPFSRKPPPWTRAASTKAFYYGN